MNASPSSRAARLARRRNPAVRAYERSQRHRGIRAQMARIVAADRPRTLTPVQYESMLYVYFAERADGVRAIDAWSYAVHCAASAEVR